LGPAEGDWTRPISRHSPPLAGAAIGGLTSFATSWLTQRTQLRHAQREAERAELKALYGDFITEASRLYGDALTHQTEEITGLVGLYAMVGRMRLASDQRVIAAAPCRSRTPSWRPIWGQTAPFLS